MSLNEIISLFAAIVSLAMVAVVIQSPNTAGIIKAWGDAFSGSLRAATGR